MWPDARRAVGDDIGFSRFCAFPACPGAAHVSKEVIAHGSSCPESLEGGVPEEAMSDALRNSCRRCRDPFPLIFAHDSISWPTLPCRSFSTLLHYSLFVADMAAQTRSGRLHHVREKGVFQELQMVHLTYLHPSDGL